MGSLYSVVSDRVFVVKMFSSLCLSRAFPVAGALGITGPWPLWSLPAAQRPLLTLSDLLPSDMSGSGSGPASE